MKHGDFIIGKEGKTVCPPMEREKVKQKKRPNKRKLQTQIFPFL
ncbi:MAG: hypothetical protein PHR36_04175 [Patescibacteria group bacterium]|nr:hypothetical protein [Patescibacteria group bacterium]